MKCDYNPQFYQDFKKFVEIIMKTFYQINVTGLENIPQNENYLLAGNHLNILDSWVLMTIISENLHFMVDKKLYKYPLGENFFTKIGTFAINPNELDLNAIKTAINILKTDQNVVIFPEGKTHKRNQMVAFKPGVPKIAKITKKLIVPFGIDASYIPFTPITINFGEPINYNNICIPKNEYDTYLEKQVRKLELKK